MPQQIRLWQVADAAPPRELTRRPLDLEQRLEGWLAADIGLLRPDLIVIGRQVETDYGGIIDLLCLDGSGDLVIVELKRDRTPRDITAQAMDYASWVVDLGRDRIVKLATAHLAAHGGGTLEEVFSRHFGEPLPETLNDSHQMLIVGSDIDAATERIVQYLSDHHGVGINAVTFDYFRTDDGRELMGSAWLIEPEQVETRSRTRGGSKRKPSSTTDDLRQIAEERGCGALFDATLTTFGPRFPHSRNTIASVGFRAPFRDTQSAVSSRSTRAQAPRRRAWLSSST